MIRHIPLVVMAIIASGAISACSDTTAPRQLAPGDVAFARSGTLHVEKDCSAYRGGAGEFCTITASSLKQLKGSRITYASEASADGTLDTDILLDPPGPGNNKAFGHCALNLATGVGVCTLSGGTGKFKWIRARVDVSRIGAPTSTDFAWDGSYRFSARD